jgi:nucleoside-diphosphate-sugar epimerase
MSILITGGAGYIGSHMVYELADARERVVVLDNLSTSFDWAVAKGVPLIVGDTGDQNLVAQIIREHSVDSLVDNNREFFRPNRENYFQNREFVPGSSELQFPSRSNALGIEG